MSEHETRIITKPHLGKRPLYAYGWYFEVEQRRMLKWGFYTLGPYWTKELAEESRQVIGGA